MNTKKTQNKQLSGLVVSNKMEKTVVVQVDRNVIHKKYEKRCRVSKKYKAHDEKKLCKIGDTVVIEHCRPISRDTCWRVIEKTLQHSA